MARRPPLSGILFIQSIPGRRVKTEAAWPSTRLLLEAGLPPIPIFLLPD